ncbi:histidinol-phosphate phosphatase family protein [Candidatus Magnetobacterium bavaricum]|uniref:Histidinol-phosphate phosphatase family protein n=1 Tax=Candidatus Magnetobacterium bavaricum TaxID=29290 RepID=A0A0F3GH98_9BACT|nr:histidinol-phosphate phosphatase family protein [Candidatus Magnetobacterium bavaricum]
MGEGKMTGVIIAGGKGERLKDINKDIPKPMSRINGKTVIEHQLDLLKKYGIQSVYILTGYLGHVIKDYFGDGSTFNLNIKYLDEDIPLGTAGCVKPLAKILNGDFIVFYGDIILDIKIDDFISFHHNKGGSGTLLIHPNDHPYDSDLVVIDEDETIVEFLFKDQKPQYYGNTANAAIYILSPDVFNYIPDGNSDFIKNVFPSMLRDGIKLYGYRTSEYVKDMGTVDRLEKIRIDMNVGKPYKTCKVHKRPAIFFDRDGTIIEYVDLLHKVDDIKLFSFSPMSIKKVNDSGYLSFIVTNQPVVARNICDTATVVGIHNKIETLLGHERAYIDRIYFCPHHPDRGYQGENLTYKIDCECRKPETGMILQAIEQYNIDVELSWMIGDTTTDIQTGINAGIKTILVRTGKGGKDNKYNVTANLILNNISDAVDYIISGGIKHEDILNIILKKIKCKNSPFVISIGGASRTGKSVFATHLKTILLEEGIKTMIADLDNWLIGVNHRNDSMTIKQRYRYNDIEKDMRKLLKGFPIEINIYDPYYRTIKDKDTLRLTNEDCVIVVGVPAIDIEGLRNISDLKLFITTDELIRTERFFSYYRWKDIQEEEIKTLYEKRLKDEVVFINSSKQFADLIIENKGGWYDYNKNSI